MGHSDVSISWKTAELRSHGQGAYFGADPVGSGHAFGVAALTACPCSLCW